MNLLKHLAAAAALIASVALSLPAHAESRTALVIGNGNYSFSHLTNPTNDASDIADALRGAGFDVILKTDANQATMKDAIRSFGSSLKTKGGVGLLFYAGHGLQAHGENYLLPIGERPSSEDALKASGVSAAEAVDAMSAAKNSLNIVILDACRDNPLSEVSGAAKGLSRIDSSSSLFVSFSTSPGAVAFDGDGRNSPYSKNLKGALATSNLTLEDTFKRTLKGVYQETRGQQQPWISSSFFGEFVFKPSGDRRSLGEVPAGPAVVAPLQQAAITSQPRAAPGYQQQTLDLGGLYLVDGTNPNGSHYRGMVAMTQAGNQYRFTWWIARQVFSGVGQFAGRMLVVNWGAKSPVIYNVAGNGLFGEWADGSASEKLIPYARAASSSVRSPEGRYNADGRNPNGSRYRATVDVTRLGDRYRFDWKSGSQSYRGDGTMEGNVLVVNWGSTTPVIYAIAENGTLNGLWDAGRAGEVLTPQ
jgi:caspase domain-containing protein